MQSGNVDDTMNPEIAQALHERYAGSVVFVEVVDPTGDVHLGTAFHLGNGLLATARHVVEYTIQRVGATEPSTETFRSVLGTERVEQLSSPFEVTDYGEVWLHPDENVDVAILEIATFSAPPIS